MAKDTERSTEFSPEDAENSGAEEELESQAQQEQGSEDQVPEISDDQLWELCQERVCPSCPQKQEMDQEVQRVRADADNYRKRMAREKEQHCKFAAQDIIEDLLPVMDNLELAVGHGRKVEACSDLVQGVDMTIQIFLDTLKKHGLEPIQCSEGEPFDPNWHEALAEEPREDLEAGKVCQVMQTGYTYKDRVVRPAKVMVSKNCQKQS
ncbi:nucleotide exchange factor GrpE [Desulfovermiculus halophilus]|uniref:nucleotide exchange factor GrpE n=1 Tax=Desulfovermiculus halophilus TaxID=339722 RepID=UPI0004808934|nr:nucleotide exchange factor GrpE [Desulfovermiculus halophilus]